MRSDIFGVLSPPKMPCCHTAQPEFFCVGGQKGNLTLYIIYVRVLKKKVLKNNALNTTAVFACHSALRPVGQEPEPIQATDIALACCFLGESLMGRLPLLSPVFSHPNLCSQVPPRLQDAREPSSEGWNYGRESCPINLAEMTTSTPFWDILHAAKYDMGQTALLPLRRKAC